MKTKIRRLRHQFTLKIRHRQGSRAFSGNSRWRPSALLGVLLFSLVASNILLMLPAGATGETFSLASATTIQSSGGDLGSQTFRGSGNSFVLIVTCSGSIKTGPDGEIQYTITLGAKDPNGGYTATTKAASTGGSCGAPIKLAASITVTDPNGVGPGGGNVGTAGNSGSPSQNLTCNAGFNPLNWLLCGVIKGMVDVISQLDNFMASELSVGTQCTGGGKCNDSSGDPTAIFGTGTEAQDYKKAWDSFLKIGLAIVAVAALVIILSQTLDLELLDAYTIRKLLPRLVIVAILMTLSWSLMQFFVQLTNDLGYGVRYLIYSPFANLSDSINLGGGGGLLVDLVTTGAIAAMGVFGLLSFVLTAALAVFAAVVVLVLRQVLITLLIIVAPVALAMSILPNTRKGYDLWKDSFLGTLLMFPAVEAAESASNVASAIAAQNKTDPISQIAAAILAMLGPFLIIIIGRSMGGFVRQLTGFVNDRHRGAFDRVRNFRGNQTKKRMANASERAHNGKIFKQAPQGSRRARINEGIRGATLIGEGGYNPRTFRSNVREAMGRQAEQQRDKMLEDHDYVSKGDDEWNRGAVEARSVDDFRQVMQTRYGKTRYAGPNGAQNLDLDVSRYRKMNSKYGTEAIRQASWISAVTGGTSYTTNADLWQAAASVAGNDNGALAQLVAKGRSAAMNAGRVDQGGGGFGKTFEIAQKLRDDANYTVDQADQDLASEVLNSQSAGVIAHASMKPRAVQNLVPEMRKRVADAVASGNQDATDRQLAFVANMHDALASTSPNKAEIVADGVIRWDPTSGIAPPAPGAAGPAGPAGPATPVVAGITPNATVQQMMEGARSSPVFQSTRRELQQQMPGTNAQGQPQAPPTPGAGPGGPPITPVGTGWNSDRRLKRNITKLAITPQGIQLYRFQYLWSDQIYVGVMAQDLTTSHPYCLSKDTNGFYQVDYAALDLEMLTFEEWEARNLTHAS